MKHAIPLNLVASLCICLLYLCSGTAVASVACQGLSVSNDGRVSLPAGACSAGELLAQLSRTLGFEVLVIGEYDSERSLPLPLKNKRPDEIIRSLLNGCSYAIVYRKNAQGGVVSVSATDRSANFSADPSASNGHPLDEEEMDTSRIPEKEQSLLARIDELRAQVESGASDERYQRMASVRDPRYVVHDRVQLEFFEKELLEYKLKQGVE